MNFAVEDEPLPFDALGLMTGKCTDMTIKGGKLWFCDMTYHPETADQHFYVRPNTH